MSEEKNLKKLFESKRIELYLRAEVRMLRDEIFQLRRERISYIYRLKRKIQKFKKKVNTNSISEKHINIINETTIKKTIDSSTNFYLTSYKEVFNIIILLYLTIFSNILYLIYLFSIKTIDIQIFITLLVFIYYL